MTTERLSFAPEGLDPCHRRADEQQHHDDSGKDPFYSKLVWRKIVIVDKDEDIFAWLWINNDYFLQHVKVIKNTIRASDRRRTVVRYWK